MQKDWIDRMSDENKALKTTIARLTAERDEARASAAAAYERAAHLIECDGDAMGGKNGAASAIRALATEAETTALSEIVKKATEDSLNAADSYIKHQYGIGAIGHTIDRSRILARLDQRKEAGEC